MLEVYLSGYIQAGSNRTFMELKFVKLIELVLSSIVLIVPLWN